MTKNIARQTLLALGLAAALAGPAAAGPVEDKAKAHLAAIAAGDLNAVTRDYAEDAYLDWVGGSLDGRYRGKAAITAMWQKFIATAGGKPRNVRMGPIESYANPKGSSIEAKAEYEGNPPIRVLHVLTYHDGELTTELWQVAPSLNVAP